MSDTAERSALLHRWQPNWIPDEPRWRQARADVLALVAENEAAMEHLREFNHVEGEPLSEVAAVAASAFAFSQHRVAALAVEVEQLRDLLSEWLTADPHRHDWVEFEQRARAALGDGEPR